MTWLLRLHGYCDCLLCILVASRTFLQFQRPSLIAPKFYVRRSLTMLGSS